MSGQLDGLSGIITGAGSGIGAGLAEGFAAAGARLVLWDYDEAGAQATAERLGGAATAARVDVRDEDGVEAAAAAAREAFGRIDFLVNNAGVRVQGPFLDASVEDFRNVVDVDLTGVYVCSRAVGKRMAADGGGKVLNIASIVSTHAVTTRPGYVAAKAGVAGLTRAMAYELGAQGIRCNAIGPGVIETPLTSEYFQDEGRRKLILDNIPLGRWGHPPDLVGPAVFLCSPAADYVSGQLLCVDGGWTAGKGY